MIKRLQTQSWYLMPSPEQTCWHKRPLHTFFPFPPFKQRHSAYTSLYSEFDPPSMSVHAAERAFADSMEAKITATASDARYVTVGFVMHYQMCAFIFDTAMKYSPKRHHYIATKKQRMTTTIPQSYPSLDRIEGHPIMLPQLVYLP